MIDAATFSGQLDGRRLFWSLDVTDNDATVDAHWNPSARGRDSALVTFKLPHAEFASLLEPFLQLERRYPSSLDGAAVRDITITRSGVASRCTVHGAPSKTDHPELEHFHNVWRVLERLVHAKIEWHRGG